MGWLAAKIHKNKKEVIFAACQCVKLPICYIDKLLQIIEKWCKGEATIEEVLAVKFKRVIYTKSVHFIELSVEDFFIPSFATKLSEALNSSSYAYNGMDDNAISVAGFYKCCADIIRKHINIFESPFDGCEYEVC